MPEWLSKFLDVANANADGIGVIVSVLMLLGTCAVWILKWLRKPQTIQIMGSGGQGGGASVSGNGAAVGGRGGSGGMLGSGGTGGSAQVGGDGIAIGGGGGDSGLSWRPALGAPSVIEHQRALGLMTWPGDLRDEFGFYIVGRGGHGGDISASVMVDSYRYPLVPLLQLLRLWAPDVLEAADATRPAGPQEFWDTVVNIDARVAKAAAEHVRYCLEVTIPKELPAPDPYAWLSR